ncbi:hypothetical protein [Haloarcula brevis]|uniref:hypothetical protein n=1 Tax=Haloarcula brevis TaxID=3111453 RepID=UPI00300E7E1F
MDKIGYIESSVFFINGSGNPMDVDTVIDRLNRLVSEYGYSITSPIFVYYLDRVSEEMVLSYSSSIGPNPMKMLPYKLEGDAANPTDLPDDDYRFYIFYLLSKLHFELDDYEGMRKLAERYESIFGDQPYFGKIMALSLLNSRESDLLTNSLDTIFEYSKNNPEYPELHKVLAQVIAVMVENDITYAGDNANIPKNENELLKLGYDEINRALEADNIPSEYLVVKAQLESLNKNHDAAKAAISQAISELSRSRTRYSDLRARFGRMENRIETRRQQSKLEERTVEISELVSEIENKIENTDSNITELNDDLDNIRDDFQRTFLEFLGFFSAIIAVIVITGQIAIEVSDPQMAGRLMIVSYGGLLFAFGGFSVILSTDWTARLSRFFLAVIGLLTAVMALYPGEFTSIL